MEPRTATSVVPIGVAGRCSNDEEKAYVKQAVFLLRYRLKFSAGLAFPIQTTLTE